MKALITLALLALNTQVLATCFYSGSFVCQANEGKYGATTATELVQFTFLYKSETTCVSNADLKVIKNSIVEEYKDMGTFSEECNPGFEQDVYVNRVNLQKFSFPMAGFNNVDKLHEALKTSIQSVDKKCKFNMGRNPKLYNCLLDVRDLDLN
ncbi:hypothetical protein [Halobacteriovorax sp. HLS]|uniref:hypothetical protein n=1 Tax=Halobacteriovorax sp. HLS TaxID=2234000 RepID=UPI000FDCD5C7|nr:hypothetical protein [Halobacteriovorax sp. HLS]